MAPYINLGDRMHPWQRAVWVDCPDCGRVPPRLADDGHPVSAGGFGHNEWWLNCSGCYRKLPARIVRLTQRKSRSIKCDARCLNATGDLCNCPCLGGCHSQGTCTCKEVEHE